MSKYEQFDGFDIPSGEIKIKKTNCNSFSLGCVGDYGGESLCDQHICTTCVLRERSGKVGEFLASLKIGADIHANGEPVQTNPLTGHIQRTNAQISYDLANVKKVRDMTAREIALLPRGTAFIHVNDEKEFDDDLVEVYNPFVWLHRDGIISFDNVLIKCFRGYRLEEGGEILPFTVED